MLFKDEVSLILYLAPLVGKHRTTLKRNPIYYQKILEHLGKQPGAAGLLSAEEADTATLRAQLLSADLRIGSLEKENTRLKKAIANLCDGGVSTARPATLIPPKPRETENNDSSESSESSAFGATAMALVTVLRWVTDRDLGLVINPIKNQIEDHTAYGSERIVVGASRAKPFFRFLSDNKKYFDQVNKK